MESLFVVKEDGIKPEIDYEEEPMDTNEDCFEEGEISSSGDEKDNCVQTQSNTSSIFKRSNNKDGQRGGFVTGFNVFDKDEASRKLDRAKRFALPVNENSAVELQNEQLTNLYRDLGIDKENERHYRFNAIHMRGTENMSTEDVFQYFASFAPSHIEWVNDVSCNVVWVDDVSSARALLNLSKRIVNLDKVHMNADPFEKEYKESNTSGEEVNDSESVDARDIKAAIPPGFWRIGIPSEKSSFILLRYATRCDKKQRNAEKNSEYYKKYGNPHYGNLPGIFSKSLRSSKKKFRSKSNSRPESDPEENDVQKSEKKNPWEELAYEWGKSDKVEDVFYAHRSKRISHRDKSPTLKSNIPDLRISLKIRKENRKRIHMDDYPEAEQNDSDRNSWENRTKIPRMKMYADDEEKRLEKNSKVSYHKNKTLKKPVQDLRSKINKKKDKPRFKFKVENKKHADASATESSSSENEYDDGDSGEWALEHYNDLRASLQQNKRQNRQNFRASKYHSESEENESDDELEDNIYRGNIKQRSPLQIEIDNDEYYQTK